MPLSQAEKRRVWTPACEKREREHLRSAYQALDDCFEAHGYRPLEGQTWGANCRPVTGGSGYSIHSYFGSGRFVFWTGVAVQLAVAVDVNSLANPYGKKLVTNMPRAMIDAILAIRTKSGEQVWQWGGYFSGNKDAMHFEIACSPTDLATGIDPATVTQGDDDMDPKIVEAIQRIDKRTENMEDWSARFVTVILQQIKNAVDADDVDGGPGQLSAETVDAIAKRVLDEQAARLKT